MNYDCTVKLDLPLPASKGGTLHSGVRFVALLFPTHMETILTPLAWLDIASADPDAVFHTNWTLVSKFDLAVIVFDSWFCSGCSAAGRWLCH